MTSVILGRSVSISSGQVEALKWLALVSMFADHVNKVFFSGDLVGWYEFGRVAMPVFGFTLAFGVAKADRASLLIIFRRLLIAAALAQLPWTLLFGDGFNILWLM